jgi:oligosaccharyl transferase (archaeosortase A-associated)
MQLNTADIPSLHDTYRAFTNVSWETVAHAVGSIALLGFIFGNRVRNYEYILQPDGTVTFPSADGWYHRRATIYTVERYPKTLNFDPYSGFDTGNQVGQFGTLFDQVLATTALVVGSGNPSTSTIDLVLAFTPPVLAVLTAVTVYWLSKSISNRWGGLVAVGVLALTPGLFLSHSMIGFIDHHIAETLLVSISLLSCVKFADRSESGKLVLSEIRTSPLASPITWGVFAGVVNGLYLLIWPPGLLYLAILSVFLVTAIITEYLKRNDPFKLALPGGMMMITSGIIVFPFMMSSTLSVTTLSLIQVLVPISVGTGCLFLGFTARQAGQSPHRKGLYLIGFVTVTSTVIGVLAVAKPSIIDFFVQNSSRVFWFIGHEGGTEIAEASTLSNPFRFGFITYGFALIAATFGWVLMTGEVLIKRSGNPTRLLLTTFGLFMASATITQPRFDYYLVIAIAVFTAYFIYKFYNRTQRILSKRNSSAQELKSKVAATGLAVLVLTPLVLSGAPVIAADSYTAPPSHTGWENSFDWIEAETPEFGGYGVESPNRVDYTGDFPTTKDYNYEAGQYGILSRWAIGHRLTVETKRVPVSNPHQQHSTVAADVLLAPSENTATDILDSELDEGSGVRYVVLGRPWGSGNLQSFTSPAASEGAYGVEEDNLGIELRDSRDGEFIRTLQRWRSYESLRTRLYQFHGSAASPSQFVIESEDRDLSGVETVNSDEIHIEQYSSAEAAAAAGEDDSMLHGGLYGEPPQQIDALQHFRLVHASEGTVLKHPESIANKHPELTSGEVSAVKTFERVPGASIVGEAPAKATVRASVKLRITTTGKTFTYTQYATANENGRFRLVLPYATTGYNRYTPENGYTNTSVRAEGPYRVTILGKDTSDVVKLQIPEGAVLGEESVNRTVRLGRP